MIRAISWKVTTAAAEVQRTTVQIITTNNNSNNDMVKDRALDDSDILGGGDRRFPTGPEHVGPRRRFRIWAQTLDAIFVR